MPPRSPLAPSVAPHLPALAGVRLASRACVMTGVGATLQPLSLAPMPCVMVNPRVPVPTRDVFNALGLRNGELLQFSESRGVGVISATGIAVVHDFRTALHGDADHLLQVCR